MAKNDKKQNDDAPVLGSTTNPAAQSLPTTAGAENTAPVPATEAGVATHLNAFRQDLDDAVTVAHQAIEDVASKARSLSGALQSQD